MEKVHDYVMTCSSLKGRISDMKEIEDFESRPHKAVTFCGRKRKGRNGTSKNCRRRYVDMVERKIVRKKHGRER